MYGAMSALVLPGRRLFIVDTHVSLDPTAEQLAEITVLAAEEVRNFGIEPKIALISHSVFGTSNAPSAVKMRRVLELVRAAAPELDIDGEMHGDSALDGSDSQDRAARDDADRFGEPAGAAEPRHRQYFL